MRSKNQLIKKALIYILIAYLFANSKARKSFFLHCRMFYIYIFFVSIQIEVTNIMIQILWFKFSETTVNYSYNIQISKLYTSIRPLLGIFLFYFDYNGKFPSEFVCTKTKPVVLYVVCLTLIVWVKWNKTFCL